MTSGFSLRVESLSRIEEVDMKFVFNKERNDEQRRMLMMQPTMEEAEELVRKDESDPYAWYVMGKALSIQKRYDEAIEAHSKGIAYGPFYAPNYFGRGGKHSLRNEYWQALADYTVAIQLDPSNWLYWYYRATTLNLNGDVESSIDDFMQCLNYMDEREHYPIVHWIYTSYAELGRYKEAEESLSLIGDDVIPPQMDYGYSMCVKLYKGLVKPEDFIDEEKMAKVVLPRPNRVHLEENTMLYGLYWYWKIHGDDGKAYDAIKRLQEIAYPGAFGYTKSLPIARKLGLIK